jgi:hypothetical protein
VTSNLLSRGGKLSNITKVAQEFSICSIDGIDKGRIPVMKGARIIRITMIVDV